MHHLEADHLSNRELIAEFDALIAGNHMSFAALLTRIAQIDERRLYLEQGYPSMSAFLMQRMRLPTQNSAYKRLTAARTACRYPGVLVAMSDGRLNLTAVLMLAPHLTPSNADALVAAALDKTCFELQVVLAERFPRPDLPERLSAIAAPEPPPIPTAALDLLAAKRVEATFPDQPVHGHGQSATPLAAERAEGPRPRVVPLGPRRYGFQFTGDQETREVYEEVRDLLSHQVPGGEMALVFKRALQLAKAELKKRNYAVTDRPGRASGGSESSRHIPASVRREVHERDGDRCTFVSESGKRCDSRRMVEFEHDVTHACGGESTPNNLRLLCRAHNQLMAEREFGTEFMERKRAAAREPVTARRPRMARAPD
jgi:5-methylcytosine-specific restriction endonuclease McrA